MAGHSAPDRLTAGDTDLNGTRRAILGVALLFFVNGVVVGSWLPRLPEIRDRLGIDLDALGLTLALGGLGSLVGSSLSGVVVARLGSRRTAVIAGLAVYLFLPLVAVAPTALLLSLVLAFMGFLDANADDRTDLCIATSVGTVLVLPGDGRGGFAADAAREAFVWDGIEAVLGADIDGVPGDEIIVSASAPGLFIVMTRR